MGLSDWLSLKKSLLEDFFFSKFLDLEAMENSLRVPSFLVAIDWKVKTFPLLTLMIFLDNWLDLSLV